ncbi:hypothetical protein LUZ63_001287 [Rhynchospora breviuscula]|uniref:DUF6598 domain-containing protein n=1 Tax=Rhynchospora breviuscula TaxID=2022672 RepID=A0A9Q0CX19_9POAL|nr:hypothetical protein LUZ63_001287 [Rhynchospora breviuscula]
METPEESSHAEDDVMQMSPRYERTTKRALVEVFSVKMAGVRPNDLERLGGLILLRNSDRNYVLYQNHFGKGCHQLDSEGYFTLIGPECGVHVKDKLGIYPWLFDNMTTSCEKSKKKVIWIRDHQSPRTDQVIRKGFRTKLGVVKIDFAVYSDAVEARIEIFLLDVKEGLLPIQKSVEIHGIVKASNSFIIREYNARSTLLDNIKNRECTKLSYWPSGEAEFPVPLTRNITVIPRESSLIVDTDLSLHCIPLGKFISVVVGSGRFDASSRSSSTVEEKIIYGARAKVKVKVHWST